MKGQDHIHIHALTNLVYTLVYFGDRLHALNASQVTIVQRTQLIMTTKSVQLAITVHQEPLQLTSTPVLRELITLSMVLMT